MIHTTNSPLFSPASCQALIADTESFMCASPTGWSHIKAGRYNVHGGWVKDIPLARKWFDEPLPSLLYPALAHLFPNLAKNATDLRVQSAYLFKYTAETKAATDVHVNSGLLSFTIALNPQSDYDGGGTWYEALNETVSIPEGHVTFSPGGLRHRGLPGEVGDGVGVGSSRHDIPVGLGFMS